MLEPSGSEVGAKDKSEGVCPGGGLSQPVSLQCDPKGGVEAVHDFEEPQSSNRITDLVAEPADAPATNAAIISPPRSPFFNPIGHSWILVPDSESLAGLSDAKRAHSSWCLQMSELILPPPVLDPMRAEAPGLEQEPCQMHSPTILEVTCGSFSSDVVVEETSVNAPSDLMLPPPLLIPGSDDLPEVEEPQRAITSGAFQAVPATTQSPLTVTRSSTVVTLSRSLLEQGDEIAALAVSELLGSNWPLMTTTTLTPLSPSPSIPRQCESVNSSDPAVSFTEEDWERQDLLRRQPACPQCLQDDATKLAKTCTWGQYFSTQPVALLAVLIASHAAAFLLGLAIGRGRGMIQNSASECMLQRRFSSGPYGMHARLCAA